MDKVKRFIVGIDCGRHTGVAIYDHEQKKILKVANHDFWSCYELFASGKVSADNTGVVVECPVKNAMYGRQEKNVKSAAYGNRMMANASSNAHEASLLADGIERLGYTVLRVRPKRRNFKTAAEDVDHVEKVTGFTERTNPHTRDAIMLAWNVIIPDGS